MPRTHAQPRFLQTRRSARPTSACAQACVLVLRYAALIRVIENPAPFVKRLARRIAQTPKLLAKIAAHPAHRGTYLDPLLIQADLARGNPLTDSS